MPPSAPSPQDVIGHVASRLRAAAVIAAEAARLMAVAEAQAAEAHAHVSALFDEVTADMALGFATRATDLALASPDDLAAVPGLLARVTPPWHATAVPPPPSPGPDAPRGPATPPPNPTAPVSRAPTASASAPPARPLGDSAAVAPADPVPACAAADDTAPDPAAAATSSSVPPSPFPDIADASARPHADLPHPSTAGRPVPSPDLAPPVATVDGARPAPVAAERRVPANPAVTASLPTEVAVPPHRAAPVPPQVPVQAPYLPPVDAEGYAVVTSAAHIPVNPETFTLDMLRLLRPKGHVVRPRNKLPPIPLNHPKKKFPFFAADVPSGRAAELTEIVNDALYVAQSEKSELVGLYDDNHGRAVWKRVAFRCVIENETGWVLPKYRPKGPDDGPPDGGANRPASSAAGPSSETPLLPSAADAVPVARPEPRAVTDAAPVDAPAPIPVPVPAMALVAPAAPEPEPQAYVSAPVTALAVAPGLAPEPVPSPDAVDPDAPHGSHEDPDDWFDGAMDPDDPDSSHLDTHAVEDDGHGRGAHDEDDEDPDVIEVIVGDDDPACVRAPAPAPEPEWVDPRTPTTFAQLGKARPLPEPVLPKTIVSDAPPEIRDLFDKILDLDDIGAELDDLLARERPDILARHRAAEAAGAARAASGDPDATSPDGGPSWPFPDLADPFGHLASAHWAARTSTPEDDGTDTVVEDDDGAYETRPFEETRDRPDDDRCPDVHPPGEVTPSDDAVSDGVHAAVAVPDASEDAGPVGDAAPAADPTSGPAVSAAPAPSQVDPARPAAVVPPPGLRLRGPPRPVVRTPIPGAPVPGAAPRASPVPPAQAALPFPVASDLDSWPPFDQVRIMPPPFRIGPIPDADGNVPPPEFVVEPPPFPIGRVPLREPVDLVAALARSMERNPYPEP